MYCSFDSRSKRSLVLVLISLVIAGSVSAQSRSLAESPWSKEDVKVLDHYRAQLDGVDHNTREGRELFAALHDELASVLGTLARVEQPLSKSASDCTTACNFANSAKGYAALAKSYANTASASSDPDCNSVYTDDAQYYAGVASAYADFAAVYACQGPGSAQTAQDLLNDAKRRASKAYSNAYYSYLNGCSESLATATQAQLAQDALFNGAFYAGQCS